jgi:hypothetical protein
LETESTEKRVEKNEKNEGEFIMNKIRRKELEQVINNLKVMQDKDDLYECIDTLNDIRREEQSYYDNIPENLQYSQRASDSEQAIEYMEDALRLLRKVYKTETFNKNDEMIKEAMNNIEEATW